MKFGIIIQMALLYVWRSWRSTIVLGVMVFTAVAALVFLSSLAVGTNDAMIRNSVGLFAGHISGEDLPQEVETGGLQTSGVRQVLIRKKLSVRLTNAERSETVVLYGVHPAREKETTALWKKSVSGRYIEEGRAEIYLSEPAARLLGLAVGMKVSAEFLRGHNASVLSVCGIYRTGISILDFGVGFVPYHILPASEADTSAAIFIEDGADLKSVLASYDHLPYASRLTPWMAFMPDLEQLVELNFVSMTIVMVLVFGVVTMGISCALIVFILKNIREHGIMKAMGVLPSESVLLIFTEVTLVTVVASAAGTLAGALAVAAVAQTGIDLTAFTSHNQYFAISGIIYPRLTSFSLWLPLLLSIVFGFLAAVWPSVLVVREKAADILRSI